MAKKRYVVIRTCYHNNRLFEVGEKAVFDESVEVPRHFKCIDSEDSLSEEPVEIVETEAQVEEDEAPVDTEEPAEEEVIPVEETKKATTKGKTTTKTETKKTTTKGKK